jgi:hypothetical protein
MKSRKILGTLIAGAIAASVINPPFAKAESLSIDEIYSNAYSATITAMTSKAQKDINSARSLIALIPEEFEWAIGEFSKQVDVVQHPIFVKAYEAIIAAQSEPTQASINIAKASIDPDMPDFYRGSYSQAVDLIQQDLMGKALTAYDKAVTSKLQEDIDAALTLIEELKTASDSSISDWAGLVQTEYTASIEAPADGSSEVPADGSSEVPADGSSEVPADGSSEVPADGSSEVPADSSSEVPADGSSEVPADGSSEVPADGSSEVPADGSSEVPADGSGSSV